MNRRTFLQSVNEMELQMRQSRALLEMARYSSDPAVIEACERASLAEQNGPSPSNQDVARWLGLHGVEREWTDA